MRNITHAVQQGLQEAAVGPRIQREASEMTRKLFVVLHGAYGNQFLAKFNTGQLVEEGQNKGKDKGMLTAMLVWDAELSRFPGDVVEAAVKRVQVESPDFAPTLPKLVNLCEAIMPRKTHAQLEGLALIPPSTLTRMDVLIEAQGDGLDWARKIKVRADAGDKTVTYGVLKIALEALGEDRQPCH